MKEPALDPSLVRAFVASAHGEFDQVKALLEQEPNLLHAAMNWGGGDWETAVGAAAHTGRRDILEWLLEKGARIDLFAAAMLGELALVKAALEKYPAQLHAAGPHGITLLQHALMGGEQAAATADFLKSMLNAASEEPEAEAGAILVENVIKVKAGFGEAVLERFAKPKQVHTFKGFIRMDVLHGKAADGDEEIRVCTTWESKADFEAWASSDSFRGAHSRRDGESGGGEQAPANGPSHGQAQGHAHGQSHGQGGALGSAAQGPVIGNKVTIYRVAASHLPASAAADASV